ncbi:MAG: DUF302 domain-containing protein [Oricola sp.]
MKRRPAAVLLAVAAMTGPALADTWIVKDSAFPVAATADRLVAAAGNAGATVFARVDHAAGAEAIGEEMAPMVMVMFGNPKLGTPILKAAPRAGLDLPLRVLVWDDGGTTRVGYLAPGDLKARHAVEGADGAFEAMAGALDKLTDAATR